MAGGLAYLEVGELKQGASLAPLGGWPHGLVWVLSIVVLVPLGTCLDGQQGCFGLSGSKQMVPAKEELDSRPRIDPAYPMTPTLMFALGANPGIRCMWGQQEVYLSV